jgi:phosphate transport system substrate-binding protein
MRMHRSGLLALFLLIGAGVLSACGGATPAATQGSESSQTDEPAATTAPVEEALSGDVAIDGSSTVFPLMTAAVEEYNVTQPDVRVSVGESGTGGGFKKFCGIDQAPSTDISNASRAIKAEGEADVCASNGVEYVELLIAYDGLTVVVNPENDFVACLTTEQLGKLFRPEDGENADTWADLDPSWPAEPIKFFVPDPDSGTRTFFIEQIMTGVLKLEGDNANIRQNDNTTFSSDDNVLLEGVAGEPGGIGFFGYAYYFNNQDRVKAVALENKAGDCTLPSDATVRDGSYNPFSRPLYIYVNKASLTEKPQVADLVRYLLGEDGFALVMEEVGYSLPPEGTYADDLAAVDDALK